MRPLRLLVPALVAVSLLSLPSAAAASSGGPLVVDQGSLGGPCSDSRTPAQVSVTTPWCTIVRAFQAAPAGSTVDVRGGTYPYQSLHGAYGQPPRLSAYVTFEPYGYGMGNPETVTIMGLSTANTSFLRFIGFHFVGSDANRYVPGIQIYIGSQDIQFINNDVVGQGIQLQSANDVLLQGNYVHNITRTCGAAEPDGFGLHLSGGSPPSVSRNITVLGNTIYDYAQTAVQAGNIINYWMQGNNISTTLSPTGKVQCGDHVDLLFMEGTQRGPTTIIDNDFHDGTQLIINNVTGLSFENNVLINVDGWMQLTADPASAIVNNTWTGGNTGCTGCGSLLLRDYAPSSSWTKPPFNYQNHLNGTIVENNIMNRLGIAGVAASEYHEDYDILSDTNRTKSSGVQGSHTIYTPVNFINPAAGNYTLMPGSIGTNAGDPTVAPTTNMLGQPLAAAGTPTSVDIGALRALLTAPIIPPLGVAPALPPASSTPNDGHPSPPPSAAASAHPPLLTAGVSARPKPASTPPKGAANPIELLRLTRSLAFTLRCDLRCSFTVAGTASYRLPARPGQAHGAQASLVRLVVRRVSASIARGRAAVLKLGIRALGRRSLAHCWPMTITLDVRVTASDGSRQAETRTFRF